MTYSPWLPSRVSLQGVWALVGACLGCLSWKAQGQHADEMRFVSPSIQLQDSLYGIVGAEDIEVEQQSGMAFISAYDRRAHMNDQPRPGAIYGLNLQDSLPTPRLLTVDLPFYFNPHGISVYREPSTGEVRLFVINHRSEDTASIEVFAWEQNQLEHLYTVTDPLIRYPNDLAALDLNRFYVTNDRGSRTGLGYFFERLFRSRKSNVVFFNGELGQIAANRIAYANGVAILPGRGRVVVSSVTRGVLHDYIRDPASGELELRREVKVGKGLDNIDVDSSGGLWIAAHPKLLKFVGHVMDSSRNSPWLIYYIPQWEQADLDIRQAAYSNGRGFSTVSVSAVWRDHILFGTVFDRMVLYGKLTHPIEALEEE